MKILMTSTKKNLILSSYAHVDCPVCSYICSYTPLCCSIFTLQYVCSLNGLNEIIQKTFTVINSL